MKRAWVMAIPVVILGAALLRKRDAQERSPLPRKVEVVSVREADASSPAELLPDGIPQRAAAPVTPETALTDAIRDPQAHDEASDAVGVLARFPTEAAVDQFRKLLGVSEPYLVRLRALQGLLLMIAWTPKDSADLAVLGQAKAVLLSDGRTAAALIERDSGIAAFRHEARLIRNEIDILMRVRE